MLVQFVKNVKDHYPAEFKKVKARMEPDAVDFVETCVAED